MMTLKLKIKNAKAEWYFGRVCGFIDALTCDPKTIDAFHAYEGMEHRGTFNEKGEFFDYYVLRREVTVEELCNIALMLEASYKDVDWFEYQMEYEW